MKIKTGKLLVGGLAGAVALNLIHEGYRQMDNDAPKVHLIGEEAIIKVLNAFDRPVPNEKNLYQIALTVDVISNTLYYSLIGAGNNKHLFKRGLLMGPAVGIGTVFMPQKMDLNSAPIDRTTKTKFLTVLWYTLGGLAAAATLKVLDKGHL